jgi:hypothetical protein
VVRRVFAALAISALAVGINAAVAGGGKIPIGTLTVDPTSGLPGTTVTVTVDNCGETATNGVGISPSAPAFIADTGQLVIDVDGWGDAFNPFVGGTNDTAGVATATFQVPNVAAGPYTIAGLCVSFCSTSSGNDVAACSTDVGAQDFGPYPDGSFTVEAVPTEPAAPAAPAVAAQATTTG